MRINEVEKQVTQAQLDALETVLDRVFAQLGIDVEFTRHFLDRVNDERNIRQITIHELAQLFKKEFVKWGKPIARLGPDAEAVMKDLTTNINIPFALNWNKGSGMLELVAKTVMRKQNFRTPNQEFPVETYTLTSKQQQRVNESFIAEGPQLLAIPAGVGAMELLALGLGFASIASLQQSYKQNPDSIPDMYHGAINVYNKAEEWLSQPGRAEQERQAAADQFQQRITQATQQAMSVAQQQNALSDNGIQAIQDYLDGVAASENPTDAEVAALNAAPAIASAVPTLTLPEPVEEPGAIPTPANDIRPTVSVVPPTKPQQPEVPTDAPIEIPGAEPTTTPAPPSVPSPLDRPAATGAPTLDITPGVDVKAVPVPTATTKATTATTTTPKPQRTKRSGDNAQLPYDDPLQRWAKQWGKNF